MRSLALLALAACTPAAGDAPAKSTASGPIILELFTSQGCSSCPPADALLGKLAASGTLADRPIVPLSFHVDYWNDLGWADPFSSAAFSDRQRSYAGALGEGRVYTPQLVIGGRTHVVGSNSTAVVSAITNAPAPALLPATIDWSTTTVTVTASAPEGTSAYVAIYEDGLSTQILRGENAGETLRNDHVVRVLVPIGRPITLDPSWTHLGAVVFAQAENRAIVASNTLPPPPDRSDRSPR
jgi:hypothetical protein